MKEFLQENKIKLAEYGLYILIVTMILFILGNYKYQPSLSADELAAIEEVNELKVSQKDIVEKTTNELANIDLSKYNVNTGYSELLLLLQDLLQLDTVSGYYNQETEKSVRALQQKHELEETGKIDDASFAKIISTSLPLTEEELSQHGELVRLLQRELNLDADGLIGEVTIDAIKQLKKDLTDDDSSALINDALLAHLIEHLNS